MRSRNFSGCTTNFKLARVVIILGFSLSDIQYSHCTHTLIFLQSIMPFPRFFADLWNKIKRDSSALTLNISENDAVVLYVQGLSLLLLTLDSRSIPEQRSGSYRIRKELGASILDASLANLVLSQLHLSSLRKQQKAT